MSGPDRRRSRLRRAYDRGTRRPARTLLWGYLAYTAAGFLLLMLPFAQQTPTDPLDVLFIAASAVSTTGLVSVDPGSAFTGFGEAVILGLIQLGGLGYMTVGSAALLAISGHLSPDRDAAAHETFSLPKRVATGPFLRTVLVFTVIVETAGVAALYPMFLAAGVPDPLWMAVFHSVSAFCTAGFSLFPTSLEQFSGHPGILLTVSALSLLGAMGALIAVDTWRSLRRRDLRLGFTTEIILRVTGAMLLGGTLALFLLDPGIRALPLGEAALAAFFQTMTAATTVGFNSYPVAAIAPALLMVLFVLMVVGGSPAGTGGGIKTTSFAALFALVRCTLRGRETPQFCGRSLPRAKVKTATASFAYYMGVLTVAMILLLLTETGAAFEVVLFEAISAMGTVGLSMGLTGGLSDAGKVIVIVLMTAGRLGILTFGIAIALRFGADDADPEDRER